MSSHLPRRLVPVVVAGIFTLPTSLCAADAAPPSNDAKSALDRALENSDSSSAAGGQPLTKPTSTTLIQIGGGGGYLIAGANQIIAKFTPYPTMSKKEKKALKKISKTKKAA